MEFLLKLKSKVKCLINDEEVYFENGLEAYKQLNRKCVLKSMVIQDDTLVLEVATIDEKDEWKDEYKKQFGEEPSFF